MAGAGPGGQLTLPGRRSSRGGARSPAVYWGEACVKDGCMDRRLRDNLLLVLAVLILLIGVGVQLYLMFSAE
jgi:hypothetical protein